MTGQEKLPDGLECCFKALAKAVFSEEGTVYFHRTFISFDGSDRTRVITRYANMAMEKGGDIAVAAKAVMIYPAIKWLLKAREIEAVIAALPEEAAQGDFCRLVGMQSMLVRLTGEKPEMRLQVRREFFERCQEFTDAIFKAVLESVYRKSTRKNMARPRLAMLLLGEDDGVAGQEEISTHTIKTYYLEIIEAVAAHSGEQIRTLMSGRACRAVPQHGFAVAGIRKDRARVLRRRAKAAWRPRKPVYRTAPGAIGFGGGIRQAYPWRSGDDERFSG